MKSTSGKLLKTLAFIGLGFLFVACSNKEDTSIPPSQNVVGNWQLQSDTNYDFDSTDYSLSFTKNEFVNLSPYSEDTIKGTYRYENNVVTLLAVPKNIKLLVDTIYNTLNEKGEYNLSFHAEGGLEIAKYKDGIISPTPVEQRFIVQVLTDSSLTLVSESGRYFSHYTKPKNKQASFTVFEVIYRGVIGILALVLIAFLFSSNKKAIDWVLVSKGILLQIVLAFLVLKFGPVKEGFEIIAKMFTKMIGFTNSGIDFLFNEFGVGAMNSGLQTFAFKILPTIIFFSALTSLFFYWGILQKVIYGFAWVMRKTLKISGGESLAAAGNIFLGQTESALLVKPYLGKMTKAEIMSLMVGGMATIAGGVLASYISFLGGGDPAAEIEFAKHLMTASVISAPAAIVCAKMLVPELEKPNEDFSINTQNIGVNSFEAIANGTTEGVKLAVNVGAMLLVFIAIMAGANFILGDVIGNYSGVNELVNSWTDGRYTQLSFEFIVGYICSPIVWLIGIPTSDMVYIGELLGQKTILNEFVAYTRLGELKASHLISDRSIIMATYILCGFSNFASIGIQVGGIGTLAPSQKGQLAKFGFKALIGGTLACLFTATIVGMLL